MPIKFKDSVAKYDRQTKKTTIEHHYIKNQSETTLREELERCFETDKLGREVTKKGKGKLKQKIMNELARREKVEPIGWSRWSPWSMHCNHWARKRQPLFKGRSIGWSHCCNTY